MREYGVCKRLGIDETKKIWAFTYVVYSIVGHLLSHPRYSATSIFKDQSVRKLRKFVLKYLGDRSGK